jgi:trans-L-3-hydroxyproline dehydratase
VSVPELGEVAYRIAYGGAFYAFVERERVGLPLDAASLIAAGRAIKEAIVANSPLSHPTTDDLGFLYGVVFTAPARDGEHHSSHVCVFADGELDRSPTGTGVSARLAILHADGAIEGGEEISIESIIGSVFRGRVVATTRVGEIEAVIPEITGMAYLVGRSEWLIDPMDPLGRGFLID